MDDQALASHRERVYAFTMEQDTTPPNDEHTILRHLLALTRELVQGVPLERILRSVADTALALLPADHTSVRVLDSSGARLVSGARAGVGLDNAPLNFRLGEGAVGWVAAMGKPLLLEDVNVDSRFRPDPRQGFEIRALLAVPFWSEGRVIGVLGATSPEAGLFDEALQELATLLANCASPFLDKALTERLANTDPVTLALHGDGLPAALSGAAKQAWSDGIGLSVLALTLQGNEGEQLDSGELDRLMRACAAEARAAMRPGDQLFRLEDHRFVLVLPRLGQAGALALAERIREGLTRRPLEGVKRSWSLQAGAVVWDREEPAEALLERALNGLL
jgi:GGDEF domain-containing protein